MTYFCKRCGAVVSGKYCSCCGTRATSDFQEFRKAQRTMVKWIRQKGYTDSRFVGSGSLYAQRLAELCMDIAFEQLLPNQLDVDSFPLVTEKCWKKLPECRELGELLYERAVRALWQQ